VAIDGQVCIISIATHYHRNLDILQTPLHLAVRSLNQPAVRTLVENDAYIHHSDSSGQTPIDLASSSRSLTKIIVGIQSKITTDASQCHIIDHYPVYVVNRALGFLIEARDAHSRRRAQGFTPSITSNGRISLLSHLC